MAKKRNLKMALIMAVCLLGMAPAIAAGDVIYVDADASTGGDGTTWGTAYKYLQDALDDAVTDDEIWVAEGTYKPDANSSYPPGSSVEDLVTDLDSPTGIALDVNAGKMYWTDNSTDKIQRANMDGSSVEDLVTTGLSIPLGIALNVAAGKMYWTDNGTNKIQRANMSNGGNVEDLVTTGLSIPHGIALDVAAGKMYWMDLGTNKIQRANMLDGNNVEDLVTGLDNPTGIALDVAGGKMYWMDIGTDKIQRANMSVGPIVEDLVTTGLSDTRGIALDVAGGKMYWTDLGTDKIQRANMDGSSVEDLVTTGLTSPFGIALDVAAGKMYWTDYGTDKIQRANMFAGSGLRTETFQLINGVGIYGGYPSGGGSRDPNAYETILSGDINTPDVNTDNSYHVVTGSGTEPNAVLDGFTITAGNADGSFEDRYGGGMYNYEGSPTVTNCTFSENTAGENGGGMYNDGSPTVTNCTFSGNWVGGFAFFRRGGGMYNVGSPTVTNCIFTGNSADYGGGMYNRDGSSRVTNCIFSGNSAEDYGGGMFNGWQSSPTVANSTFSGNFAVNEGGGMYNSGSSPTLNNCILWGNSDAGGSDESAQIHGDAPTINYSCVQGWTGSLGGWGNIDDDPCFVDPNGLDNTVGTEDDNLRLSADSNCIDAGDNTAVPADTADLDNDADTTERTPLDLDGLDRFIDDPNTTDTGVIILSYYPENVDMGAYEFYGGPACGDAEHPYPPGDVSGPDGVRDCYIDFFDFAVWALHWLECTAPECD